MSSSVRLRLIAKSNGIYASPPREVQILIKEWKFLGITFHREIDREEIPLDEIAFRPIGGNGWVSKFAPFGPDGILKEDHPKYQQYMQEKGSNHEQN
jgi:hypothetical protein